MAVVQRKTTIVGNPGKRYFGGLAKRTKSAGARRRPRSRVSNPGGSILGFTLGNPGRKANMAKAKRSKSAHRGHAKKTKNPGRRAYSHKRKSSSHRRRSVPNPGMYHRRRIKRNPGFASSIGDFTMNAVFVLVGGLGSKLGTQAVLGSNNVGLVGYAGNAAVGGILWFLTRMLVKNKSAESGIISGTILQILLRVINDYTPFGSYVNQLGMGDYQMQSFVTPQVLVDPWNNATIQVPPGWGPAPQLAAPAASTSPHSTGSGKAMAAATGTSGLYGRGGGWGGGLY